MGLTPLGGIAMGTRSGDLDPSIITYLMKKENMNVEDMNYILNKESGAFGISEVSVDFRDIEQEAISGDKKANLSLDVFHNLVASYIAKYSTKMGGLDYIVFTGGVGENQINIRKGICEKLEFMGVEIDEDANNSRGEEKMITKPDSKVKAFVVPTNEELMIAKETMRLVKA